jgi:hypothetical protein
MEQPKPLAAIQMSWTNGMLYCRLSASHPWRRYTELPPALRKADHPIGNKGYATMQHMLSLGASYAPREQWIPNSDE